MTIDLWCLRSLRGGGGGHGGSGSILNNLLILLNSSSNFFRHVLLIMLGENLGSRKIALYLPRLLGNVLRRHLLPDLVRERFHEPFHNDGVPFPEQIRQRSLVPYHDVGDEIGDDELHLRRRRRVHHAAFQDKTAQPKPRFCWIVGVFFEGFGWGDVEDELVLEVVENDHDEAGEATEGERVGPEAPRLELARACADVDGFLRARRGAARRGEEAVEGEVRRRGLDGRVVEKGGWEEGGGVEEMGSESQGESRGHLNFLGKVEKRKENWWLGFRVLNY